MKIEGGLDSVIAFLSEKSGLKVVQGRLRA